MFHNGYPRTTGPSKDYIKEPDGFEYFEYKGTVIFIHDDEKKYTSEAFAKLTENWTSGIDVAKLIIRYIPENSDIERSIEGVQALVKSEIKDGVPPLSIAVIGFGKGGLVALFACPICEEFEELAGVGCCSTSMTELRDVLTRDSLQGKASRLPDIFVSHWAENLADQEVCIRDQQQLVEEMLSKGFKKIECECYG